MVKVHPKVKQLSEKELLEKAQSIIESALSDIPFVKIRKSISNVPIIDKKVDLVFDILVAGKPTKFIVEVKSLGEPLPVRTAASQINDYLRYFKGSYGILIAPYLSNASRRICREEGIGCVDLAGNAFINFKNIYIDRGGKPNPFTINRLSRSLFAPKSARILRVLLSAPLKKWYVENLSKEATISIGLASRVKRTLLLKEWIKVEKKGFYLIKPEEVLNQWVSNYSYQKNPSLSYYSGSTDDELESVIDSECKKRGYEYGLALFSGARKIAPFVRSMKFFSYIDGDIEDIAKTLQMKKVESGANVTLFQPYDKGIFYGLQELNGIKVVSDIQLYLDLKSYKGRGEEAAQAIFEQKIKPRW